MPTRTYTGIDFLNYLGSFASNTGTNAAAENPVSQMNFSISSSGSNNVFGAGFRSSAVYEYIVSADLDFDAFPAIPDGSTISKIEVRIDISLTASGTATDTAGDPFTCIVDGIFNSSVIVDGGECTDIKITELASDSGPDSAAASLSGSDHYSNVTTFDFSAVPITKAELITRFTSWLVQLDGVWIADGFDPGSSGESSGFTFSGIRISITYQEGPAVSFTIEPTGGELEPGQIIVVTGPNASEQEYFFETADGVIPVIPQIINDDEVWIELPYPATDPCFDCFPECPECDSAFAPCDEDLTSDDCIAAMEACLGCLSNCLEDLQLAEECQQSTQEPSDTPVPVVLVVGTQFSGNVLLGNFVVIVANGSGLYKFDLNQTHDELYSTSRDGTTYNVKIPNPGGKTGFFRS